MAHLKAIYLTHQHIGLLAHFMNKTKIIFHNIAIRFLNVYAIWIDIKSKLVSMFNKWIRWSWKVNHAVAHMSVPTDRGDVKASTYASG